MPDAPTAARHRGSPAPAAHQRGVHPPFTIEHSTGACDPPGLPPGARTWRCSAHYFDRDRSLVAYSWYAQGTRFLDISNPAEPIQVAYYRPDGGVSFAPYCYEDVVIADINRGIDIVRLDEGATTAREQRRPVEAPPMPGDAKAVLAELSDRYGRDGNTSFICVIPLG